MGEQKFKVSVVLPAFNEELIIEKTLQSIKDQDYDQPFEIIVCDNNSTDRTREIAEHMGAKVIIEKRKGTRFAYDTAMKNSVGEIILITNADVILPKNWISSIVKQYDDPSVVGIGTRVQFYDCPQWINAYLNLLYFLSPKHGMWGVSMSCRRWVYEKVGGFNHGVNTNEDAIFHLLIEKYGTVKIIEDVTVLMDGRRFNKGFLNTVREWFKGYGFNSLGVQINYIFFNKIKALNLNDEFKDYRSKVYGKGEDFQICTILTVNNDAETIIPFIYSYKRQVFDKKGCLVALLYHSNDESANLLKLFPFVKVFHAKKTSWSENILDIVLDVKAPVYAFTMPDVRLPENWLKNIYERFEKNSDIDLVGGPYVKALESVIAKSLKVPMKIFENINEYNFACKREVLASVLSPGVNSQKELLEEVKDLSQNNKYSNAISVVSFKENSSNIGKVFSSVKKYFTDEEGN